MFRQARPPWPQATAVGISSTAGSRWGRPRIGRRPSQTRVMCCAPRRERRSRRRRQHGQQAEKGGEYDRAERAGKFAAPGGRSMVVGICLGIGMPIRVMRVLVRCTVPGEHHLTRPVGAMQRAEQDAAQQHPGRQADRQTGRQVSMVAGSLHSLCSTCVVRRRTPERPAPANRYRR